MKLWKLFTLVMLFTLGLGISAAAAQETLAYGDTVEGEMTVDDFEFSFNFEGEEGDVVVADVRLADSGAISTPELYLYAPNGDEIARFDGFDRLGEAFLFAQLPEDGTYEVVLTRQDGRSGDDVGPFIFSLQQPDVLEAGESVVDSINLETGNRYYVVETDEPALVRYSWTDANERVPFFTAYVPGEIYGVASASTRVPGYSVALGVDGEDEVYVFAVIYEQSSMVIYEDFETDYVIEYLE